MLQIRRLGFYVSGLALLSLVSASPAPAQVSFLFGNNPQPGEENILLNSGDTGTTVIGVTNQSNTSVSFTSAETLFVPASGQARIEGQDGLLGPEPLTISLANGGTFQDLIFNPFIGGAGAPNDNDLIVTVDTTAGVSTFTYTLSNGQNFLTVVADAGVGINSVSLDPVVGFSDLRQVRISGAGVLNVPEANTLSAVLGMGVLGVVPVLRRRRKK